MSKDNPDAGALVNLIATLSIPEGSKVPDPADGKATTAEYDRYFRIVRDNPDLLKWSRTCIDLLGIQLADLSTSTLDWQEKSRILEGMLLIQRITLEKWIKLGEAGKKEGEAES
jgi:hypothetical protein